MTSTCWLVSAWKSLHAPNHQNSLTKAIQNPKKHCQNLHDLHVQKDIKNPKQFSATFVGCLALNWLQPNCKHIIRHLGSSTFIIPGITCFAKINHKLVQEFVTHCWRAVHLANL
jgi:hypothetical protein